MSDSEDDWDKSSDDLDIPAALAPSSAQPADPAPAPSAAPSALDDDWGESLPTPAPIAAPPPQNPSSDKPMIIVDVSMHTNHAIHNRNDRNSNNDPVAVSKLRAEFEASYESISTSSDLLASSIVIPCSSGVFPAALQRLRDEKPGHFFLPIFPPK